MSTAVVHCDRCEAESDEGLTWRWVKLSVPTTAFEDPDPEDLELCPERPCVLCGQCAAALVSWLWAGKP